MKKKILNYKYTTICSLAAPFLVILNILIMLCCIIVISVFTIREIENNGNYIPLNVTIINTKNSFALTNNIYIIYDFDFYYNNTLRNVSILCGYMDCVNIYHKYKINDTISIYKYYDEFRFNTNIYILVAFILAIPLTIVCLFILLCGIVISIIITIVGMYSVESHWIFLANFDKLIKSKSKEIPLEIQYE